MDLKTVKLDVDEIKERLAEYEAVKYPTTKDLEILRDYKTLHGIAKDSAGGTVVVDLVEMMAAASVKDNRPLLAVAKASRQGTIIKATIYQNGQNASYIQYSGEGRFDFPDPISSSLNLETTVPIVPPRARPDGPLDGHAIVWEATWNASVIDRDPVLLAPIAGSFYQVISEWELTDVEAKYVLTK